MSDTFHNLHPKISIVIPTLNEGDSIEETIKRIPKSVKEYSEILVVDGLSKDDTVLKAKKNGAKVIYERRRGKGIAMRRGARIAKGEILIFMDGDGTYPSEEIPNFIQLLKGSNLVIGNAIPFIRGIKSYREKFLFHALGFMLSKFLFGLIGMDLDDPLDGMRAIRRSDFKNLNLNSKGFEIEAEMNLKARMNGYKIVDIPIRLNRRRGRSKFIYNLGDQFQILRMVLSNLKMKEILRSNRLRKNRLL